MRILVLVYEFPPVGGGGGAVARDLSQGFAALGHDVKVLTAHMDGLPRTEQQHGFHVIRVPSWRREAFRADMRAMAGYIIAGFLPGWRLIRSWKPDVIHVHFAVPSGVLAWILSTLTRVPYVLTAHLGDVPGGAPDKTNKWFRRVFWFTPPIWKGAAKVVAVSEFTRSLAIKQYPVNVSVIPNGVDCAAFTPGDNTTGVPQIAFAGRFMHVKNPLEVVNTLAMLRDLPWHCTMMGDGPLRGEIENAIAQHNLEDRFTLPGWVTPQEVQAQFSQSDILFMPSLSEGLPVVGVQALAMGLALVVGRAGGFIELVDPGLNGYLVDGLKPGDGVEPLRTLLTDPQKLRAFRHHSRESASRYDLPAIVAQYEALFHEVCGE